MTYNIDSFHIKELENFTLSINNELVKKAPNWQVFSEGNVTKVIIDIGCETDGIKGTWDFEKLTISIEDIEIYGKFSGTSYHEILKPLFSRSEGKLRAIVVWEGGDSVEMLTVEDGVITEENMLR